MHLLPLFNMNLSPVAPETYLHMHKDIFLPYDMEYNRKTDMVLSIPPLYFLMHPRLDSKLHMPLLFFQYQTDFLLLL